MILRYTILYVDDVAATLDFYRRAFALEQAFLHPSGDYGELSTGETKLVFSSKALMRQLGKAPPHPRDLLKARARSKGRWKSGAADWNPPRVGWMDGRSGARGCLSATTSS